MLKNINNNWDLIITSHRGWFEFHLREINSKRITILGKYLLNEGAVAVPRFFMNIDLSENEEKLKQNLKQ